MSLQHLTPKEEATYYSYLTLAIMYGIFAIIDIAMSIMYARFTMNKMANINIFYLCLFLVGCVYFGFHSLRYFAIIEKMEKPKSDEL